MPLRFEPIAALKPLLTARGMTYGRLAPENGRDDAYIRRDFSKQSMTLARLRENPDALVIDPTNRFEHVRDLTIIVLHLDDRAKRQTARSLRWHVDGRSIRMVLTKRIATWVLHPLACDHRRFPLSNGKVVHRTGRWLPRPPTGPLQDFDSRFAKDGTGLVTNRAVPDVWCAPQGATGFRKVWPQTR